MVRQVQTIDEYYESDDDDDSLLFYAPTYYTTDEQLVILACLMLLEQRYRVMQSMTPQRVLDEIDDITKSLKKELKKTAIDKIHSAVYDYFSEKLLEYGIPQDGYVTQDTSMDEIVRVSIDALCNQLRDELKVKSLFFRDNMSKDDFDILPNFRRTVKKLTDAIGNNLIYSKEKSERKILEFVYDEDVLWLWVTKMDSKVCEWCLDQEMKPPRKLEDMPLDHPKGRCTKAPLWTSYNSKYTRLWDVDEIL